MWYWTDKEGVNYGPQIESFALKLFFFQNLLTLKEVAKSREGYNGFSLIEEEEYCVGHYSLYLRWDLHFVALQPEIARGLGQAVLCFRTPSLFTFPTFRQIPI